MKSKRLNKLHMLLCGFLFVMPATAVFAGAESGFYAGGGLGDVSVEEGSFDESDTAVKAFVGFNFGLIPLIDVAVEAAYMELGSPGNVDVSGLNASGLVGLNFGPLGIFAKTGFMDWEIGNDSGTDTSYGVGAKFQFSSLAVRAEYETVDADGADINITTASVVWTF